MGQAANVFVSLGSNIRPEANLRLACRELERRFGRLRTSSVYRNPAVGFDGDDFLNMVVSFESDASPEDLRANMEELHAIAQRKRLADPFSPRTLDADVLLVGDQVSDTPQLPHRDIDRYDFVLGPLAELAPEVRHPVKGTTMRELWRRFDRSSCALRKVNIDLQPANHRPAA